MKLIKLFLLISIAAMFVTPVSGQNPPRMQMPMLKKIHIPVTQVQINQQDLPKLVDSKGNGYADEMVNRKTGKITKLQNPIPMNKVSAKLK